MLRNLQRLSLILHTSTDPFSNIVLQNFKKSGYPNLKTYLPCIESLPKWRAENTVKTANENELVDELKVATKAKVTYLTEEAHCRSSRKNRVQRKASLLRSYRQWCLRQGSKSL